MDHIIIIMDLHHIIMEVDMDMDMEDLVLEFILDAMFSKISKK
jgi:hypothetical protein